MRERTEETERLRRIPDTTTVRLLGRLPRVNYLLAYDRKSTINTLRNALGTGRSGAEDYLEKIVQYPLGDSGHPRRRREGCHEDAAQQNEGL